LRRFIAALSKDRTGAWLHARLRGTMRQGAGDMKTHATRRTIIRGWLAPPTDKRAAEEQMQRIANAFFFGVTIFSIAFAYFVLSAKAQDQHLHRHAQLHVLSTSI
jgi:hypothetical protein